MEEARCFVQFMHPGDEHRPDTRGEVPWNPQRKRGRAGAPKPNGHRRKFIVSEGRYITAFAQPPTDGDIAFWGEWEPPSRHTLLAAEAPRYPTSLARPYLRLPESFAGLHNTDPFVFGDEFLYTNCKQWSGNRPKQERYLLPGSVILFGSSRDNQFVLDTVFVVRDSLDYGPALGGTDIRQSVSEEYYHAAIAPIYADTRNASQHYRLYRGATPKKPYDGMFSFFPCCPFTGQPSGFPKPVVRLDGIINPKNRQANRLNRDTLPLQYPELWSKVARQVLERGLSLGVRAAMPPRES